MAKIFLSMPFSEAFNPVADTIRHAAADEMHHVYRTDDQLLSQSIPSVIFHSIRESSIVIADLTDNNPNVLNEVGIAQAMGKPLILISQRSAEEAPFNIRSLRILTYVQTDLKQLSNKLRQALSEAASPSESLRMLLMPGSLGDPTQNIRFVIGASPLSYRRAMGRKGGYKKLRKTSSDHVGIRGIYQAFGLLYGFDALPDTVDPEDCDDDVLKEDMNLFCIASPKANRWTQLIMAEYSKRWVPKLEFRADETSKDLRNVKISIFSDGSLIAPPGWPTNIDGDRYFRDFGLVVRGPNPFHDNRMVLIMAGRSSLGTEAACTAVTTDSCINEFRKRLKGIGFDLDEHRQPFWALVSMKRSQGDEKEEGLAQSLMVHQVDAFRPA